MDDRTGNDHADEHKRKAGKLRNALEAGCAISKVKAKNRVNIGQNHADDFAEAKRDDRQIVAAQTQRRNTDDQTENTRNNRAEHNCDDDIRRECCRVACF